MGGAPDRIGGLKARDHRRGLRTGDGQGAQFYKSQLEE